MSGQIQTIVTPTGPLSVIRPVAERLLKEGVVSGTLDGVLHAADAAIVKTALMTFAACDFCSSPGSVIVYDVPDFGLSEIPGNAGAGVSTGGWGACDACKALIDANKRDALVDRALESHAFPKFSRHAIQELLAKFWQGMDDKVTAAGVAAATVDFIEDRLPWPAEAADPEMRQRDKRIARIAKMTGLTSREIDVLREAYRSSDTPTFDPSVRTKFSREMIAKLVAFDKSYKGTRDMGELLRRIADAEHKPLPPIQPHWQTALDMKFAALSTVSRYVESMPPAHAFSPHETDLNDPAAIRRILAEADDAKAIYARHNKMDATALQHAEAYSFNAETAAAITAASASIPHETPLSAIDTPGSGRAGWFWFADPLAVPTTHDAPGTNALLWYWATINDQAELCFSAYVVDRKYQMMPAAFWRWRLTATFHDLIAEAHAAYDKGEVLVANDAPFGREATVKGIAELTLFFVAACTWMKQLILVGEAGHIERHARKRYVREHKLATPPEVKVIALRRSHREPSGAETPKGEPGTRNWTCRWIVSGHPRLQKVGPGRKDVKLIWIDPYPKGPENKPLRTQKKVYAVVR